MYKRTLLLLLPLSFLTGCGNKADPIEQSQLQATLHEIQMELSEMKYQLNTHQTELAILEEKLTDEAKAVATVKKQLQIGDSIATKQLRSDLELVRQKLTTFDKQQERTAHDLRKLEAYAAETSTTFSQYKTKLQECENHLSAQSQKLDEIKKLRSTIASLSTSIQTDSPKKYQVAPGDSLEKIAQKHGTTAQAIKQANNLLSDKIIAGQLLTIPE